MRKLTPLEEIVSNNGERLIPGVTQDINELIRHRNSYVFWRQVIMADIEKNGVTEHPIRIIDLGSGVGHGCVTLADIPGVEILGVDNSVESVEYATMNYATDNVRYEVADLIDYVKTMDAFDYVVSRGVLEHIPGGLELARQSHWKQRLMFDVPYEEAEGNPHHVLHFINEQSFSNFPEVELLYQDLKGFMYDQQTKPVNPKPNMVMCCMSAAHLPKIAQLSLEFPYRPWYPAPDDPLWEWQAEIDSRFPQPVAPPLPQPTIGQKVIGKIKRIVRETFNRD